MRPPTTTIRFGDFEFDSTTLELREGDRNVALSRQPALVLRHMLERPGELVTREEVADLLWPDGTHVEVDLGINNAVRRLRRALGDSAQDPDYIETLTGRGYRFCWTPDEDGTAPVPTAADRVLEPSEPDMTADRASDEGPRRAVFAMAALVAVAVLAWMFHVVVQARPADDESADRDVSAATIGLDDGRRVRTAGVELHGDLSPGHDKYLEAMYLLSRVPTETVGETPHAEEHVARAIAQLRRSLTADPDFAPAWVALARAHLWSGLWRPPFEWGPEASSAARRAVELEPGNAQAHAALSEIYLGVDYHAVRAQKHAEHAVSLDPMEPWGYLARARALAAQGQFDMALRSTEQARRLDPTNDIQTQTTTFIRFLAGRYDEALDLGEEILAVRPEEPGLLMQRARIAILQGDEARALDAATRLARNYSSEFSAYSSLDEFWLDVQKFFERPNHTISNGSWFRAIAAFNLGHRKKAARILLAGCRDRDSSVIIFAPVDPQLRSLRGEPRFEAFLECLGGEAQRPSPPPRV